MMFRLTRYPTTSSRLAPALLALALVVTALAPSCASAQTLNQRWSQLLNGTANGPDAGFAVKVGPDGNVVMTANSAFQKVGSTTAYLSDILTVKYNGSTGVPIWQRRSHATADRSDIVTGLALDSAGNAVVVGMREALLPNRQSFYAAKYAAADGALLWERVFNTSCYFLAVGIDHQGNVLATGTARLNTSSPIESDIYTFKFAGNSGATLWENHYTASGVSTTADGGKALAVDAEGNALVTGYATFGQYTETVTLKIAGTNGATLWAKQRRDSGTSGSSGEDIAVAASGDAFVASTTTQGFGGLRVVKYRGSDGTELWVNVQDGPQRDEPSSVAIDSQGNAVVTGYSSETATGENIFTRKVNGQSGQTVWTKTYDGGITSAGLSKSDRGVAVEFDPSDNAVVAGYSNNASGNGPDTMVLKYTAADGTALAQQRIAISSGGDLPGGKDALVVGVGHVTLTGSSYNPTGDDIYTLRLNNPAKATATSLAATGMQGVSATVNSTVNPNGSTTTARFEYGLSPTGLANSTASQSLGNNFAPLAVSATIAGLSPGTTYYFRVRADSNGQTAYGETLSFTTLSDDAKLASLALSEGALNPAFDKLIIRYIATVPFATSGVTVTSGTNHPRASAKVNGTSVTNGSASGMIALPVGNSVITLVVTAEDGITTKTYTITVTRLPLDFTFNSATDVPVTADGFTTGGYPVNIVLNYLPLPGTSLTMVNNTSLGFIDGTFANLAQGQQVSLSFGGTSYDFVANYFGGTGNDLVLQWAHTRLFAWGSNSYGQIGDDSTIRRLVPTGVNDTSVLSGKTATAVAEGYLHSLVLCSDGTLASWGYNIYGQLGNNGVAPSPVPIAVDRSGALAGKTVVAISAGPFHNLALCSDGSVAAWGYNNYGQLGTGDKLTSRVPVSMKVVGALAGKQVVAVAASAYSSFALCADGSLVAWGYNDEGELGDGTTVTSLVPVAVTTAGTLAGKKIASISAGLYHTLALCTDGTLVSWGYNKNGQLGNNTTIASISPVAIGSFGSLVGKTAVAVQAGKAHSLALCADGTVAAWGANAQSQLGVEGGGQSSIPLTVNMTTVTTGKTIVKIAVGANHSLALLSDGTQAAWGDNTEGQLGNNSTATSAVPSIVDTNSLGVGMGFMLEATGSAALHNLAIVALPSSNSSQIQGIAALSNDGGSTIDDDDHDGIPNLVEYAFGLNPLESSAGQLPQWKRSGDNWAASFTEPAGMTGILYGAEWSPSMAPGSWQEVPDTGVDGNHIFSIPAAGIPGAFMRFKVTRQQPNP